MSSRMKFLRLLVNILTMMLITSAGNSFAQDWSQPSKELTPWYILNQFPICNISSSRGNLCKYKRNEEIIWSTPRHIEDVKKVQIKDNSLLIETDDWLFKFDINKTDDERYDIIFADKAKIGTYHVVTKFDVRHRLIEEWNYPHLIIEETYIDGETLEYIGGSPDDQDKIGVYQSDVGGVFETTDIKRFLPRSFVSNSKYEKNPIPYAISIDQIDYCDEQENAKISADDLVERQGLFYQKFKSTPFSGIIEVGKEKFFSGIIRCGLRHGTHEEFFKSGQLKYQSEYRYGLEHGQHISFNENGTIRTEVEMFEGITQNQIILVTGSNGKVQYKIPYHRGQRHGEMKMFVYCKKTKENINFMSRFYVFGDIKFEDIQINPETNMPYSGEYLAENRCL